MGLKREAGVSPAWSRHCNWCDLFVRVAQPLAYLIRLGRPGESIVARSQETCLQACLIYASRMGLEAFCTNY